MSEFLRPNGVFAGGGETVLSTSAEQLPSIKLNGYVIFTAHPDNAGNIAVGGEGVTMPDQTDNTTAGLLLTPGEKSVPFICENINIFHAIAATADDSVVYSFIK